MFLAVLARAELRFPLVKTGWTVGQQPPLLEGVPASKTWESFRAESKP